MLIGFIIPFFYHVPFANQSGLITCTPEMRTYGVAVAVIQSKTSITEQASAVRIAPGNNTQARRSTNRIIAVGMIK
jgi:hypothetical protein